MDISDILGLGRGRSNILSGTQQFSLIDTDSMVKRLRIREEACAQGRLGLPSPDSESLDAMEQTIVNEIEAEAQTQYGRYLENQRTYADRAGGLGTQTLILQIGAAASNAATAFASRTHSGSNSLYLMRKEVMETEADLTRFREKHQLENRPARNIGSTRLKVGFLLLILLFEALANGYFLAKGSEFGLFGGIALAVLVAGLNILIGVAAGRLLAPFVTHRNWVLKFIGLLSILSFLVVAVTLNLFVAHYRDAMGGIDPTEAARTAIITFKTSTLGIADAESWLMFALGISFSIIAAMDGWIMNDPYPGYGRRAKAHRDAAEDYTREKEDLLGELEDIKKEAEKTMNDTVRDIQVRQGEYEHIITMSQSVQSQMAHHFDHIDTSVNTLLRIYRTENIKCRKDTPPPKRFDQSWSYNRPLLQEDFVSPRQRNQNADAVSDAMTEFPKHQQALNESYLKAMTEYRKIVEMTDQDFNNGKT